MSTTGSGSGRATRPRRSPATSQALASRRTIGLVAALVVVLMAGGALTAVLTGSSHGALTQHDLAKASDVKVPGESNQLLPASNAALMGLERLGGGRAPDFTLVDQHGRRVSLASIDRTHAVVLTFMDDRCTDICPIVAQELVEAHHDLGPAAPKVAFVGVNVNAAHHATRWLRAFIGEHGLARLASFTYLTGPPSALRSVWARYHVTVKLSPLGAVFHSEAMYFLAPGGAMRYVATPFANQRPNGTGWLPAPTIAQWGRGIAHFAEATLR